MKNSENKNSSKKILILVPQATAQGGISSYYQSLRKDFSENIFYFYRGSRTFPFRRGSVFEFFRFINDIIRFIFIIVFGRVGLIQTTTSFTPNSIIRDGFFVIIAKLFRKRVIVFFRGWDNAFANSLVDGKLNYFKQIFFKADAIFDLANENIRRLKEWGYTGKCFVETTAVDSDLFASINSRYLVEKCSDSSKSIYILFLARVELEKGIYELLEAFKVINERFEKIKLIIAGDGLELGNVKKKVKDEKIENISFTGFIKGKEKIKILKQSSIYVLPSYREGMPNSLLEAMSFGLPVITTNVGGIPDIFEDGENGYITPIGKSKELARIIMNLLLDPDKMKKISKHNHEYAKLRFISNIVAQRVEGIYNSVLMDN